LFNKRTEQFAKGLDLVPANSPAAKLKGVTPLESVLVKRETVDLLNDMKARSVKRFGR
jgi:hypothetical protein